MHQLLKIYQSIPLRIFRELPWRGCIYSVVTRRHHLTKTSVQNQPAIVPSFRTFHSVVTRGHHLTRTSVQNQPAIVPSFRTFHSSLSLKDVEVSALGITDYEQECRTWKLEVPEYYNFARDKIDKLAAEAEAGSPNVNECALWWVDDEGDQLRWTYPQLAEYSKKLANVLSGPCRVRRGDVLTTVMSKQPEWWLLNIACCRIGAILSPCTVMVSEKDIRYRVNSSQSKCIIAPDAVAEKIDQVVDDCPSLVSKLLIDPDKNIKRSGWLDYQSLFGEASSQHECVNTKTSEPMIYFFTSGTTGEPKIAVHTHSSYPLGHTMTARYWFDLLPSDVQFAIADPGWAKAAWGTVYCPWNAGSCVFIHSGTGPFDAKRTLEILQKYPVTVFCAPPTVFRLFIQEDLELYKFPSLRHLTSGGEPMNPEVSKHFKNVTSLSIREGYGQSETTLLCTSFRFIANRPGSMGKPAPGYDIRIINDNHEEVERGIIGDIAVKVKPTRPVGLFKEYLNEPERTAAAFRGDYYLTGDRGYQDDDGYFHFVTRSDDVIITAGYRIGPFEVESALIEHPAVLESAVVSSPDPTRGQAVKAFIVKTSEYDNVNDEELIRELQDHTKKVTAPYKYPRKIEFVKELPKTISGKIRRVELRAREWNKS